MLHQQQWVVSSSSLVTHCCTPGTILIFQKLFFHKLMGFTFSLFLHTSFLRSFRKLKQSNSGQYHSSYPKMESPAWAEHLVMQDTFDQETSLSDHLHPRLRHSSAKSMSVQQFKWRNTLLLLGKTHQKKTKDREEEKKSQLEAFIIFLLECYTTLPHLWNGSGTLTNTLKRQKHTRDLVPEAQNRTGSQNWVTFDLLRPTQ